MSREINPHPRPRPPTELERNGKPGGNMNKTTSRYFASIVLTLFSLGSYTYSGAATLVLKRSWIEKFKDRATIEANFTVDHAHAKPNAPAKDGDIHVAGRAPKEIGLPMAAYSPSNSSDISRSTWSASLRMARNG